MKKIIIFLIMLTISLVGYSQEQQMVVSSKSEVEKAEKYPISWFVGVGGGFNISTDIRQYSSIKTGSGTGTSLDIYVGRWITHNFGVRVGYHGYSTSFNDVELPSRDHGSHPFYYIHADAVFRPTTWLVPYVHAGYIDVTHSNSPEGTIHKHTLGGGVGVVSPIRFGDFQIIPGVRITMMNGDVCTWEDIHQKKMRFKFSATIGAAYTFGKQKPKVIQEIVEVPIEVLQIDTVYRYTHTRDTVYIMNELQSVADKINAKTYGDVLFDLNSSHLRSEAYPILLEVVDFMKQNPNVYATIEGHACIIGFDTINQQLSEKRAQSVCDFLIAHGIDSYRLKCIGYGSKRPKVSNDTDEGRKRNRRIEFIFTIK